MKLIKWIASWFEDEYEHIVQDFDTVRAKLLALADRKRALAVAKVAEIAAASEAKQAADVAVRKATNAAARIGDLIGE